MDALVIAQIALAVCQDMLFALVAGTLACAALLPRSGAIESADGVRYTALRSSLHSRQLSAGLVLVLACGLYLWLQAAVMSGSPLTQAGAALAPVLTESHYGSAWIVGCLGAVGVVLATLTGGARDGKVGWLAVFAATVLYAAGKAAASHAADDGDFTVREAVHVIHLCATATWAGSVIVAIGVLRRLGERGAAPGAGVIFRTRLSHLATAMLALVLISGIYNATRDTAAAASAAATTATAAVPLLSTSYGRVLVVKLVLVAGVVMLGGWNRLSYLPQMRALLDASRDTPNPDPALARTMQRFDRLLACEALAMMAILVAAGVLGHTSPTSG